MLDPRPGLCLYVSCRSSNLTAAQCCDFGLECLIVTALLTFGFPFKQLLSHPRQAHREAAPVLDPVLALDLALALARERRLLIRISTF